MDGTGTYNILSPETGGINEHNPSSMQKLSCSKQN